MNVRNKRTYAVDIAHVEFSAHVEAGETVEVPDEVGGSLIEQTDAWEQADTKATRATSKENS